MTDGISLSDWNGENHRRFDDKGRDLDMADVLSDALNDPSLNRPCDTPDCDGSCPLVHELPATPRIKQLTALVRGMTIAQEGILYGHLLALLAGLVDGDQWDEALEQTLTHMERTGLLR